MEEEEVTPAPARPDELQKAGVPKTALRMSFADYKKISNLLVLHMQKMDERECPQGETGPGGGALKVPPATRQSHILA